MKRVSFLSNQCPVCNGTSVHRIEGGSAFRPPTHNCPDCGSKLKTGFSIQVLWAVPVTILSLAAALFVVVWLQRTQFLSGFGRAAIIGGIGGLAFAISGRAVMRGIVFRPVI
jgi:hypothetical protein